MKLEEQIKEKFPFTNTKYIKEYVEIVDNHAIGFAEWIYNIKIGERSDKTTKQLLEIYKETL